MPCTDHFFSQPAFFSLSAKKRMLALLIWPNITARLNFFAVTALLIVASSLANALPLSPIKTQLINHYSGDIEKQRELYRHALDALETQNMRQYKSLRAKLEAYPLISYLDYRALATSIDTTDNQQIDNYRARYANNQFHGERLAQRLTRQRLYYLAKNQRWTDFISLYTQKGYGYSQTSLQCHYATALHNSGNSEAALTLAKTLWLAPRSQPKACDSVFAALKKSQSDTQISSKLAWQRYTAAFANNQITLANYLLRYLNTEHHRAAEQLLSFYRKPETLPGQWQKFSNLRDKFTPPNHYTKTQNHLLKRAIRSNLDNALSVFSQLENQSRHDAQLAAFIPQLKTYAIQRFALKDYHGLEKFYRALGKPRDTVSLEWMIRSSLANANWASAARYIDNLPDEIRAHDRWQYWQLRTDQLQGKLGKTQLEEFAKLAGKTNFYGFYGAHTLALPATIVPQSIHLETPDIAQLMENSRLLLALEYFNQEQIDEANYHWLRATNHYDTAQKIKAAYLASHYGWHYQAINTLATAGAWQHYAVRFPDFHRDSFNRQAQQLNQPANWLYATARQESALSENARSSAGALGLMQILPSTAAEQAKALELDYQAELLFDPQYSIKIGSAYLNSLHSRYNNRALSSAAYNAGPRRVDQWLANLQQPIPLDAWIESIRFSETRQYVQNILSFSLIHASLHSHAKPSSTRTSVKPLHFVSHEDLTVRPLAQQLATQLAQNAR